MENQHGQSSAYKHGQLSQRPKNKKRKKPGFFSHLSLICLLGSMIYMLIKVFGTHLLPIHLFLLVAVILIILFLLFRLIFIHHTKRKITRFLCGMIAIAFTIVNVVGVYYLDMTVNVFDVVTTLTEDRPSTITTVVLNESKVNTLKDLNGKKIALMSDDEPEAMEKYKNYLNKEGIDAEFLEAGDMFSAARLLTAGAADALALPEADRQTIHETDEFYTLQFISKDIDHLKYEAEHQESYPDKSDPVKNLMNDPFTILISGNDSYGEMQPISRSDVNMLVTVNPITSQILITSVPRDFYIDEVCANEEENACETGSWDKLTHVGLDGIKSSEMTMENAMDIDINYNARINFSSLVNFVDALGGIDVYVEPGYAVEKFYTNPTQGVKEGWNHLDGEGALAFSRERYAYQEGDLQRIRNQQTVIKAILKEVMSPQMFLAYPDFIEALSVACETNLTSEEIKTLVRMELASLNKWKVSNFVLRGYVDMDYCTKLGDSAYVTNVYTTDLDTAKKKIDAVLLGNDPDKIEEADPTGETYTDVNKEQVYSYYW